MICLEHLATKANKPKQPRREILDDGIVFFLVPVCAFFFFLFTLHYSFVFFLSLLWFPLDYYTNVLFIYHRLVAVATCSGIQPLWLLYLCIAFGILFLIMLIINVFLCSAMTCSCSKTEVIEKEPSIIEEYDPYRSWHGSQYGSRYVSVCVCGGGGLCVN